MSVNDDLLNAIHSYLGSAMATNLTTATAGSDLFELYTLILVLRAAEAEGATTDFRNVHGDITTSLFFRASPGYIWSTAHPYSHAVIEFAEKETLEAHLGVRVSGKSKVLHELDVCVLPQSEGETCRQRQVPPRSSQVVIGAECKFYSTPLRLGLAREFLGLTSDVTAKDNYFVSNSSSGSVSKLLAKRGRKWDSGIVPGSSTAVSRLQSQFQTAFVNYKAQ